MEIIEKHPEKPWNWLYISMNPNITMEMIEKHPEKPWNWIGISCHPNLTMEIIEKHPNERWDLFAISRNMYGNLSQKVEDKITKYLND